MTQEETMLDRIKAYMTLERLDLPFEEVDTKDDPFKFLCFANDFSLDDPDFTEEFSAAVTEMLKGYLAHLFFSTNSEHEPPMMKMPSKPVESLECFNTYVTSTYEHLLAAGVPMEEPEDATLCLEALDYMAEKSWDNMTFDEQTYVSAIVMNDVAKELNGRSK